MPEKKFKPKLTLSFGKSKLNELDELRSSGMVASYPRLIASRKALESPAEELESQTAPYPSFSTGRRRALTEWMTNKNNPLTARVAVNHVWMRHFGKPLVSTVSDFGRRSSPPEMKDLLDFLSSDLIVNGWKMKRLHRLIMTCKAWKRKSVATHSEKETNRSDKKNSFFWRKPSRRVESQVLRDSILHLAGEIDLSIGGPSLDSNPAKGPYRRSIYFKHSRDDQNKFLVQFDDADIESCYRREESVLPQQALALINSQLALSMAGKIAKRIGHPRGGALDEAYIKRAFNLILGRSPSVQEIQVSRQLLQDVNMERQKTILVHALINHHEFISIK